MPPYEIRNSMFLPLMKKDHKGGIGADDKISLFLVIIRYSAPQNSSEKGEGGRKPVRALRVDSAPGENISAPP